MGECGKLKKFWIRGQGIPYHVNAKIHWGKERKLLKILGTVGDRLPRKSKIKLHKHELALCQGANGAVVAKSCSQDYIKAFQFKVRTM